MNPSNSYPKSKILFKMLEYFEIPSNSILLVHSAFKTLALDGYDVKTVLQTFIEYMQAGTLLLPTMSWRFVKPEYPYFDERNTPSNTGILTEFFRTLYATHRSLHPTHSVAGLGSRVSELLGSHHLCETPCSSQSPFGKLVKLNGYVIMLGVGMDCCSLIHHVEEKYAPHYYVSPPNKVEQYYCKDRYGKQVMVNLRRHLFLPRNYWQFQDIMAARGELRVFRCDNSICLGFSASALYHLVAETLKKQPDAIIARSGQRYRMM